MIALPAPMTATAPLRDAPTVTWNRSSVSRCTSTSSSGDVPTTWRRTIHGRSASSTTVYQHVRESAAQAKP